LAATLFSLFATLSLAKLNIRTWLTWYLNCCAENGGRAPSDITAFLPWEMSAEKRRELAIDPNDIGVTQFMPFCTEVETGTP
jgi:transposase